MAANWTSCAPCKQHEILNCYRFPTRPVGSRFTCVCDPYYGFEGALAAADTAPDCRLTLWSWIAVVLCCATFLLYAMVAWKASAATLDRMRVLRKLKARARPDCFSIDTALVMSALTGVLGAGQYLVLIILITRYDTAVRHVSQLLFISNGCVGATNSLIIAVNWDLLSRRTTNLRLVNTATGAKMSLVGLFILGVVLATLLTMLSSGATVVTSISCTLVYLGVGIANHVNARRVTAALAAGDGDVLRRSQACDGRCRRRCCGCCSHGSVVRMGAEDGMGHDQGRDAYDGMDATVDAAVAHVVTGSRTNNRAAQGTRTAVAGAGRPATSGRREKSHFKSQISRLIGRASLHTSWGCVVVVFTACVYTFSKTMLYQSRFGAALRMIMIMAGNVAIAANLLTLVRYAQGAQDLVQRSRQSSRTKKINWVKNLAVARRRAAAGSSASASAQRNRAGGSSGRDGTPKIAEKRSFVIVNREPVEILNTQEIFADGPNLDIWTVKEVGTQDEMDNEEEDEEESRGFAGPERAARASTPRRPSVDFVVDDGNNNDDGSDDGRPTSRRLGSVTRSVKAKRASVTLPGSLESDYDNDDDDDANTAREVF